MDRFRVVVGILIGCLLEWWRWWFVIEEVLAVEVECGKYESADIIFDDKFADPISDGNSFSHTWVENFGLERLLPMCNSPFGWDCFDSLIGDSNNWFGDNGSKYSEKREVKDNQKSNKFTIY